MDGNCLGTSIVMIINALKDVSTLTELNLNENKSRSRELTPAIATVVRTNKFMETLLLNDSGLNDECVIKIAESLYKHHVLKFLNLRNNNMSEKAAKVLASVISNNTELKELYLGNNQLGLGASMVATSLKTISTLEVLDLQNNSIPEQAVDEISAAMKANISLKKLWLDGNHLESSTVKVVKALKAISTLKELNLNDNTNRSEELAPAITSVIAENIYMDSLLLSDNGLNDDGVIKIAQSLSKHSNLKILNLRSNNLTEKAAKALATAISSNTRLEELYLGNNQIGLGATNLATSLKGISSLEVLDIGNNNIPEQVADELSTAIKTNVNLKKLWLGVNLLGSSTVKIVNALKEISTLKELNLNDNKNISKELAHAITSAVKQNEYMEKLLLSNNRLNNEGVIMIAQSLCEHSKLKLLNLRNNNITEEAAEALASIISSNTQLEELYLGNNQLRFETTKLEDSLKTVSSLKVLDLNIPEQVADKLSSSVVSNTV